MNEKQMKEWIDEASYEVLLRKWRFEPAGSLWFQGAVGAYFADVMRQKKTKIGEEKAAGISRLIGWNK